MHSVRRLLTLLAEANNKRLEKDYQAALLLYVKAVELTHPDADLLATIANCYYAIANSNVFEAGENYREAVTWMEKALILAPNDARKHAILAQYYELGLLNYEQAAQEYRKAIALNSNDALILSNAAALYGVPEDVVTRDEAIAWLEHATYLEPDNPNYRFRLGKLYREANRLQDTEQIWMKSLLCPQSLDAGPTQIIKNSLNTQ